MDVEKMIEKKAQQTKQTVENIHLLSHQQSSVGYILYIYLCMYIWTEKKVTTKEPHNTHNIITLLKCTLWENGSLVEEVKKKGTLTTSNVSRARFTWMEYTQWMWVCGYVCLYCRSLSECIVCAYVRTQCDHFNMLSMRCVRCQKRSTEEA